jgi:predicted esterase
VNCISDTSKSYALYLPTDYDTSKSLPVIIFFDAHARGRLPLKLYKLLSNEYHFILAGSNNSQNGMDVNTTQQIASTLLNDIQQRVNINPKLIYVSGFSGGAKVACTFAFSNSSIRGVIACAAPFGEQLGAVSNHPDVFMAVGNQDFNLTGVVQADNALAASNFIHQLVIFNGKHDWCDTHTFDLAMQWIQLQAINNGALKNDALPPPPDFNAWKKEDITNDQILAQEANDEQVLGKDFTGKDLDYWKNEIAMLQQNEKASGEKNRNLMYSRELNYIRMMGFIYSDGMLKQDNQTQAEHFLKLYEMADPQNHDVYFLWAILNAKSNKSAEALAQLKKAAQLGFSDLSMLNSYAALASIKQMNGYKEIYEQIVKNAAKE